MSDKNPLNLDCWFEGDEIVFASGERIPRHRWYPVAMEDDATALRAALARSEQRAEAMRDVLEKTQWIYDHDLHRFYCPVCGSDREIGHEVDCIIGIALSATPPRPEPEASEKAAIAGMMSRLRLAEKVCHAVGDYAMANTQTVPFVEPRMLDAHAEWRAYVHRDPSEDTPPRAGEEGPPATTDVGLLAAIAAEANTALIFCEIDDADIATPHIVKIQALCAAALTAAERAAQGASDGGGAK